MGDTLFSGGVEEACLRGLRGLHAWSAICIGGVHGVGMPIVRAVSFP